MPEFRLAMRRVHFTEPVWLTFVTQVRNIHKILGDLEYKVSERLGSEDMTLKFKQIKVVDPNVAEHIAESARLNAGIRVRAGTKIRLELNWYHASGVDFWVSVYMKKKKGNILAKNQRRPSECERRTGARPQKLGRRVAGMQKPIGQELQVRQAPEAE
ncbi:hypothetical protein Bbelb_290950 [Branchiostoma belcheri]|nr:hypothetical protein Bbelb_290950 [Branchiostoma belcheri]